jgi:hypothetical protein
MSDVWRLRLVSLVALLLLFIMPGLAVAGWRVLPATGFVADPLHIRLIHTIGGLWIRTDQNGDQFLVHQGVPIVLGDVIDAMAVCYRADPGTWITAIGLVEFLGVGDSTGKSRHFDRTDLKSPTDSRGHRRQTRAPGGHVETRLIGAKVADRGFVRAGGRSMNGGTQSAG